MHCEMGLRSISSLVTARVDATAFSFLQKGFIAMRIMENDKVFL